MPCSSRRWKKVSPRATTNWTKCWRHGQRPPSNDNSSRRNTSPPTWANCDRVGGRPSRGCDSVARHRSDTSRAQDLSAMGPDDVRRVVHARDRLPGGLYDPWQLHSGEARTPYRPMWHAMVLGIVGLVVSIAGAVATWNTQPPIGTHWYPLLIAAISIPCAWLGGWIRERQLDQ